MEPEVFQFDYSPSQFHYSLPKDGPIVPAESSEFDRTLIRLWNKAKSSKVFKYDLNLLFKSLPGRYGLTVQLNCERAKHRRKPHHFKSIRDAFDTRRFNFSKINKSEILLRLNKQDRENSGAANSNAFPADSYVTVNNSPIGPGHSLLIPSLNGSLPQVLTLHGIRLATDLMLLSSCRFFHVVFNSILALASVNHLHLHVYYWPYSTRLIDCPSKSIGRGIYVVSDWILPGFAVQLRDRDVDGFAERVYKVVNYLTESETPHNLFIARAPQLRASSVHDPKTVTNNCISCNDTTIECNTEDGHLFVTFYIFPRKPMYGTKPITTMAPASCELGGHILVYNTLAFQDLTEEKVLRIMLEEAKIDDAEFQRHCQNIRELFDNGPKL